MKIDLAEITIYQTAVVIVSKILQTKFPIEQQPLVSGRDHLSDRPNEVFLRLKAFLRGHTKLITRS